MTECHLIYAKTANRHRTLKKRARNGFKFSHLIDVPGWIIINLDPASTFKFFLKSEEKFAGSGLFAESGKSLF
jgi:hypothetical protein